VKRQRDCERLARDRIDDRRDGVDRHAVDHARLVIPRRSHQRQGGGDGIVLVGAGGATTSDQTVIVYRRAIDPVVELAPDASYGTMTTGIAAAD